MISIKYIKTTLVVGLLIASVVGGTLPVSATQTGGPDGMVTLGADQITEDLPTGANVGISAADLEGAVYASDNASTLEVVLTTPDRAGKYLDNGSVVSNDEVALVLRDDESHAGREVGVDAGVLEDALGYRPQAVYAEHGDGEDWQRGVEYRNGAAVFEVPRFSSNAVTFSGGISLSGSAAADGTQYSYQLDSLDGLDNFNISVTGVEQTAPGSWSTTMRDGETTSFVVGGTSSPRDVAVTLTGTKTTTSGSSSGTGSATVSVGGNIPPESETVTFTGEPADTQSATGTGTATGSFTVGGNLDPTDESVSVSGRESGSAATATGSVPGTSATETVAYDGNIGASGGTMSVTPNSNDRNLQAQSDRYLVDGRTNQDLTWTVSDTPQEVQTLFTETISINDDASFADIYAVTDIYIVKGTGDPFSGTKVASDVKFNDGEDIEKQTINISNFDTGSYDTVTVGFRVTDIKNPGDDIQFQVNDDFRLQQSSATVDIGDESGTKTVSTTTGTSGSTSVSLSGSSTDYTFSGNYNSVDYTLDYSANYATEDPTVDVDGDGTAEASWTGIYRSGESSTSQAVDGLTDGSNSISTTTVAGPGPDWTFEYQERTGTEDPTIDVDADGTAEASHTGVLPPGSTSQSYTLDGLSSGDNSISTTTTIGPMPSWTLSYDQVNTTEDPTVDIGAETVSHSGQLSDGESVSQSVTLGSGDASVSASSIGAVNVGVNWTAVTETRDPAVTINGYTTSYNGTLAKGETTTLASNPDWIESGDNNVTVSTNSPSQGPGSLTGLDYSHDTASISTSANVTATSWTENVTVSNTFPSAQTGATVYIPFSDDDVAEIKTLDVRTNGGGWTSPDYSLNGNDLTVNLGDVSEGDEVEVRARARKVRTTDGSIEVLNPTVEGDQLATEIEVTDRGPNFGIDVGGTSDRVHYASDYSWTGDRGHVEAAASGSQTLRLPGANVGSSATIKRLPMSVTPESGEVTVSVDDPSEPRFSIGDQNVTGASTVDVTYYDTVSGDRYVLLSVTEDMREIDADRAQSPVTFTIDGDTESYVIEQRDEPGRTGAAANPPAASGGGAPLLLVLPVVGLSVVGLFYGGRRFGIKGSRGTLGLVGASVAISLIGAELVTPQSVFSALFYALGDGLASGVGALLSSVGLLVALWFVDQRIKQDIPPWIMVFAAATAAVMTLEAIRPGSVLGVFESALSEVGGLVVMTLLGILVYVIYARRKRQVAEARTPETSLSLSIGDDGDGGQN